MNKFIINELLQSNYVKKLVAQARNEAKVNIQPLEINDYKNFETFVHNVAPLIISNGTKLKLNKLKELFDADNDLNTYLNTIYENKQETTENKENISSLVETLQNHQEKILNIKPPTSPPPNTRLINLINEKIKKLDEISDQRFPEAQEEKKEPVGRAGPSSGGSISTNNSIRKQIFTDLKYITKYLKYKTKYIVFKSKHQFN